MKRFRRHPLAALLAVALLLVGVLGIYRLGWREGYGQAWMQAQPREDEAPAPDAAPFAPWGPHLRWGRPAYGGRWPMSGGHLGRLLSLLLVLLLLGALWRVFRFKAWRMHRAHGPHPHARWGHGPHPHAPWGGHPCGCDEETSDDAASPAEDEQVAKVQPEPDAD